MSKPSTKPPIEPIDTPFNRRRFTTSVATLAVGLGHFNLARTAQAETFDHTHAWWTTLLKKHVVVLESGQASQVRYAGFMADRASLRTYLNALSAVTLATFATFSKPQQQAFLINAYNAFTIELILTKYPHLPSIRDLGNILSSPWERQWIKLLDKQVSLDDIEHAMLRKPGVYDEPRVHFAVNCASIGCPPLREEAFVAEHLATQLSQQTLRFLSDRSRNRWNPSSMRLEVSKIFDWYAIDFHKNHQGIASLVTFLGQYADQLADAPDDRARIRAGQFDLVYLNYDWKLNDAKATVS
ncbi:MAG: DUF547 domain-containing protein [Gammaproteobacteria bacterium]|nr:DUF547 domain-containing protein [Gammaproteobacteria bacterium]